MQHNGRGTAQEKFHRRPVALTSKGDNFSNRTYPFLYSYAMLSRGASTARER